MPLLLLERTTDRSLIEHCAWTSSGYFLTGRDHRQRNQDVWAFFDQRWAAWSIPTFSSAFTFGWRQAGIYPQ